MPGQDPSAPIEAMAPRARGGWRVAGWILLAIVLLCLAAAATHPWWLAPAVSRYLSATAHRDVHFDFVRLGFGQGFAPRVHLRGVRIDNAPWAETKRPFAVFDEAHLEFTGRRSEGRWVVSRVHLKNGEINLERHPDGRRNWRLRHPDARGPGNFWFGTLEAEGTSLSFLSRAIDLVLRARSSPAAATPPGASAAEPALPSRIDFDGSYRGVDYRGSALTGRAISLLKSGLWFPLRGHVEIEGVRIEIDGRAADLVREPRLDARMQLAGQSLAAMAPWIGDRYDAAKSLRAAGRLSVEPGRIALADAQAKVGATDFAGTVAWSRDERTHRLRADLRSDFADFADLRWLAGRAAPVAARAAAAVRPALVAARAVPAQPASAPGGASKASAWDAELSFAAKRLHVAEARIVQSLATKAKLLDGRLDVSSLDLGLAGGHATGSVSADLREPQPAAEARLDWRGIRLEKLLPPLDASRRISGTLHGRAALKARGADLDALLASAAGNVSLRLADGTIASMLDAMMGLQAGKVARTYLSGNEALPLPCAAATLDVVAGRARIRSLVVDSANTRTTGSGSVDLGKRSMELVLTPTAKRPGLLDMGKSIRLHGPWARPERVLVDRVGKDAGGGAC